jgi:hypothetical protein
VETQKDASNSVPCSLDQYDIYYLNIEIYRLVIYIRDKIVFLFINEEDVRG